MALDVSRTPSQTQTVLLKGDMQAALMAPLLRKIQNRQWEVKFPIERPHETEGLIPYITEHRLRAVHVSTEKHLSAQLDDNTIANLGPAA